jgi:hypothetical protein
MSGVKDPIEKKRRSLERTTASLPCRAIRAFARRGASRRQRLRGDSDVPRRKSCLEAKRSNGELDSTARKPKRSLKKLGVMSLSQAIEFKDGPPLSSRWSLRILYRNKKALEASQELKKRPRRT